VVCAADFIGYAHRLLRAQREQLYEEMTVLEGWHKAYACDDVDTHRYEDSLLTQIKKAGKTIK
jgi:hypothetical protein